MSEAPNTITPGANVVLASPYGYLRTPGGGEIENGRVGEIRSVKLYMIAFEGENGKEVVVPSHWIRLTDNE